MDVLQVIGILLEGGGLLVGLYGLRSRYLEFAPPGQGAFDRTIEAGRRVAGAFVVTIRRGVRALLRRRPKHVVVVGAGSVTASGAAFNARGRVGFGPLPTGRSNKPALAELDRRTRDLLDRVSNVRDELQDETAWIDGLVGAVRDDVRAESDRFDQKIQRLATGDAALQYVGFAMIGLGLMMQGIALAMSG